MFKISREGPLLPLWRSDGERLRWFCFREDPSVLGWVVVVLPVEVNLYIVEFRRLCLSEQKTSSSLLCLSCGSVSPPVCVCVSPRTRAAEPLPSVPALVGEMDPFYLCIYGSNFLFLLMQAHTRGWPKSGDHTAVVCCLAHKTHLARAQASLLYTEYCEVANIIF